VSPPVEQQYSDNIRWIRGAAQHNLVEYLVILCCNINQVRPPKVINTKLKDAITTSIISLVTYVLLYIDTDWKQSINVKYNSVKYNNWRYTVAYTIHKTLYSALEVLLGLNLIVFSTNRGKWNNLFRSVVSANACWQPFVCCRFNIASLVTVYLLLLCVLIVSLLLLILFLQSLLFLCFFLLSGCWVTSPNTLLWSSWSCRHSNCFQRSRGKWKISGELL